MKRCTFIFAILFLLLLQSALNSGNVYLVIGSDTAIWDGMSVNRFNNFYNIDLYANPMRNAYRVMDPQFRAGLKDSHGNPLKMTWWMMAGNIFRYATNRNVPIPNIMTLYLMKKYHGQQVLQNGDELSLHYHTFIWSDYNEDGIFYWNQAEKFLDCFDDFNYTLAQFLLEEQIFPVSFRSGWHYMDNDWQHYLDDYILPYSLHNDYPAKHIDTEEPIDNNYDWSLAPSAFVPFRPSKENYQLPSPNGKGWNVRSAHFFRVLRDDLIDTVFAAAQNGQDQVACFWGHLPEKNFITNIEKIDSVLHNRLERYPNVHFYYCTAIEAMQRWRQANDTIPPQIEVKELSYGDKLYFEIHSDETIFQKVPFVAVKDVYEDYRVLDCQPIAKNTWQTTTPVKRDQLAKVGIAVCDTLGNQTLKLLRYLPEDIFLDNQDENFSILQGDWSITNDGVPWNRDALQLILQEQDSVAVQWQYQVKTSTYYNLFVQWPKLPHPAKLFEYILFINNIPQDTIAFKDGIVPNEWQFLKTLFLGKGDQLTIELLAKGKGQAGCSVAADVLKISALVRDRELRVSPKTLNFGEVSWSDTVKMELTLKNFGRQQLQVTAIRPGSSNLFVSPRPLFSIAPMSEQKVAIFLFSEQMGLFEDTLHIESNDPKNPVISVPIFAQIQNYFEIIDNEDSCHYAEFGDWHYSNAQAYGATSRYAFLNRSPLAYARFFTQLKKSGIYELYEIVPKTKNATNRALYELSIDHFVLDSIWLDQNEGSGNWVSLGRLFLPANVPIEVRVVDTGESTGGDVLRADAFKFLLIREITDLDDWFYKTNAMDYHLWQNYPNPFNGTTVIQFRLLKNEQVRLAIYNMLGKRVKILVNKKLPQGEYRYFWDGTNEQNQKVSSGVYYYQLESPHFKKIKKMVLLR